MSCRCRRKLSLVWEVLLVGPGHEGKGTKNGRGIRPRPRLTNALTKNGPHSDDGTILAQRLSLKSPPAHSLVPLSHPSESVGVQFGHVETGF